MNISNLFKNRAFQFAIGALAGLALLSFIFGSVIAGLFKLALWGGVGYGAYMGYKHIIKPWNTQRVFKNRMRQKNPDFYDHQEISRKVGAHMKDIQSRRR